MAVGDLAADNTLLRGVLLKIADAETLEVLARRHEALAFKRGNMMNSSFAGIHTLLDMGADLLIRMSFSTVACSFSLKESESSLHPDVVIVVGTARPD